MFEDMFTQCLQTCWQTCLLYVYIYVYNMFTDMFTQYLKTCLDNVEDILLNIWRHFTQYLKTCLYHVWKYVYTLFETYLNDIRKHTYQGLTRMDFQYRGWVRMSLSKNNRGWARMSEAEIYEKESKYDFRMYEFPTQTCVASMKIKSKPYPVQICTNYN